MQVFDIKGTDFVVVSDFDGDIIDAENGFFIDELENNFQKRLYAVKRDELVKTAQKEGWSPRRIIEIGHDVDGFYIHKPLFHESEEYYRVTIDREKNSVNIRYDGSAPRDLREEILWGQSGRPTKNERFF